jgi:hypothetical protein
MPLSLTQVAADFEARLGGLDPASPTCAREAWEAFIAHVHEPVDWPGPRPADPYDDAWDITSGQPGEDRVVVQLQRRIGRYMPQGDFDQEAVASCALRFARDERWAGVDRLVVQCPAATAAAAGEIDAARRRAEATAGFAAFTSAPVQKVTLSISGFPAGRRPAR